MKSSFWNQPAGGFLLFLFLGSLHGVHLNKGGDKFVSIL